MKRNGFTLIELMIVVAIVGILAAIIASHVFGKRHTVDGFGRSSGSVVADQPAVPNSRGLVCVGGRVMRGSEHVVVNGETVKC